MSTHYSYVLCTFIFLKFIGQSRNGKSMLPKEKIMTFLHYIGGDTYRRGGCHLGHGKSTNMNMVIEVRDKLYDFLVPLMIKKPTVEEANHEADLVSEAHEFPKSVFLFFDGTYLHGNFHFLILY